MSNGKTCKECGLEFKPRSPNGKYCSVECRKLGTRRKRREYSRVYYEENFRALGRAEVQKVLEELEEAV